MNLRRTDSENKPTAARGLQEDSEFGMDGYTLYLGKWISPNYCITQEPLAQCCVPVLMGGFQEKRNGCCYMSHARLSPSLST